jgi:hypothetical protein
VADYSKLDTWAALAALVAAPSEGRRRPSGLVERIKTNFHVRRADRRPRADSAVLARVADAPRDDPFALVVDAETVRSHGRNIVRSPPHGHA